MLSAFFSAEVIGERTVAQSVPTVVLASVAVETA